VRTTALGGGGGRGCARTAMKRFFADRPVAGSCPATLQGKPLVGLAPRSIAAAGGPLAAVERTLDDLSREVGLRFLPPVRGGGLRAGRFAAKHGRLLVSGFSYVPRLAIGGTVGMRTLAGRYVVRGAASGALTLSRKGTLHGTLDGRRVLTHWHRPAPLLFG